MENILPSFGHSRQRHGDDIDEYGRRSRLTYAPGVYEYTGQPQGFEHLGSPPKQRLEDMDARTIAQLGYEGPEGERRKVDAINEQIYEREVEREGYRNGVPIEGYRYREGYSDGYDRERQYSRQGVSGNIPYRSREEEEYRRTGRRPGDRYDDRYDERVYDPRGRTLPPVIPVTVERKYEEDGTVVENLYPDNTTAALYSRPDHGKIHYGRQDSFPETVLQEAAAESAYRRGGRYPPGGGRYPDDRLPPRGYAPPYDPATSSYGRPYEGSSSDYIDPNYRRY